MTYKLNYFHFTHRMLPLHSSNNAFSNKTISASEYGWDHPSTKHAMLSYIPRILANQHLSSRYFPSNNLCIKINRILKFYGVLRSNENTNILLGILTSYLLF